MVAVARALSGNMRLLLLDEPFEGLAPTVVQELFTAFDRLRQHVSIVIVEHNLDLVLALADRVYALERGAVFHEGRPSPAHQPRLPQRSSGSEPADRIPHRYDTGMPMNPTPPPAPRWWNKWRSCCGSTPATSAEPSPGAGRPEPPAADAWTSASRATRPWPTCRSTCTRSRSRSTTCSKARVLTLDEQRHLMRPHDFVYVPPGVRHSFHNTGTAGLVFLVITTPASDEEESL